MSAPRLPVIAILSAGFGLGFAGDYLLRAPGGPGLNFTLLFAGIAGSVVIVSLNGGPRLSREAWAWLGVGLLFGMGPLWRGSETLRILAFVSAATAFTFPALHAGRAWMGKAGVVDLIESVAGSGVHAAFGSGRLLHREQRSSAVEEESHQVARSVARTAIVGTLLAIVPVIIFGSLFFSADPVFANVLGEFVRIDLASFASHVALIGLLSWLASGYLVGLASGTRLESLRATGWRAPTLKPGEVAVALGIVDLLFLVFVFVQARYLFGGAEMVEVTPGLTYAAYAREGFFHLVAATALGLPWLLAAAHLMGQREGTSRWIFRALAGTQLVLLLAVVASAVQRMRAYLDAYGMTEDRFIATAVLIWLAGLVVWFGATVLRERRDRFIVGVVLSGFCLVAVLHVANPTAYAARSHLDRATATSGVEAESSPALDVSYLAYLRSDATPVLIERLEELPAEGRCEVAKALLERWGDERPRDWRNWNRADWRARDLVASQEGRLRAMASYDGGCE